MIRYLSGLFKYLFNPAVSLFTKIDIQSRISRKAKIYGMVQVTDSSIGDYTYIGRHSRVIHADVGKFCSIAGDVKIGMGTHTLNMLSTSPIFTECHNATGYKWTEQQINNPFKRVTIGNDVWIGTEVIIMGGVTIGDGAVIGAGAIVTKDVSPYAIVVGVPAKVIRYRFPEESIHKLEELRWWDLPEDVLKENIALFQSTQSEEAIESLVGL